MHDYIGKMDVQVALHDVSNKSSPEANLGSNHEQVVVEEYKDHSTIEQPSSPVNSVKDPDQVVESGSGFSVPKHLKQCQTNNTHNVDRTMKNIQKVQEQAANTKEVESLEEQEVSQELIYNSARSRRKEEKNNKRGSYESGSSDKDHCVSYDLPPENEGTFSVFDLVWGKVKSHPWWPGQIFPPSDSSEKAMKYYKKDCYLVAYFGDRTFAWNDASVLKPFRNHFSQAERQNNTEAFQNAVNCALKEVSRRVGLGLACSCLPDEVFDEIKYQIVDNTGIKEESSKREGVDRSTGVDFLQPDKLAKYVRELALFPSSGVDRLDLVIAKAQLLALNQLRGNDTLAEFEYYEGLVEFDHDTLPQNHESSLENGHAKRGRPRKRKHDSKDIVYKNRKEKGVLELTGNTIYCNDGEFDTYDEDNRNTTSHTIKAKHKLSGFLKDYFTSPPSTKTISLAKVSQETPPSQQSFKVGERIRRVAFHMTGSTPVNKGIIEENNKHSDDNDDFDEVLESPYKSVRKSKKVQPKIPSLENTLSQLHLCARDPMKGYSFLGDITRFFSEFRNLAITTQRQKIRKRKKKSPPVPVIGGSPETFEFDERNDSYWTDMVVEGETEPKPSQRIRKRKNESVVSNNNGKPLQRKPRKYTRKQYHPDNHESVNEIPTMDDKQLNLPIGYDKQLNLPTELILKFAEIGSLPSEVNLNKMFKCFGPLKEIETKVDRESSCARVVFKKRSDAEVAYSSAATFNIFGSTLVDYQLNYTPSTSLESSGLALTNGKVDAT